jgi:hypothetical protein
MDKTNVELLRSFPTMQYILNDTKNDEYYFLINYYEMRVLHWFESFMDASDIGKRIEDIDTDANLCIIYNGEILSLDGEQCVYNNEELYIDELKKYTISAE